MECYSHWLPTGRSVRRLRAVSTLKRLKDAEKAAVGGIGKILRSVFRTIHAFVSSLRATRRKRISILVVPHSEGDSRSFQISLPGLWLILAIAAGTLGFGIFATLNHGRLTGEVLAARRALGRATADLDVMRDETGRMAGSARRFEKVLQETIARTGFQEAAGGYRGLSELGLELLSPGEIPRELGEMRRLSDWLERSVVPLGEIGALVESHSSILKEIPSIWPIRGGIGHISMHFGQNRHPFTGQWYIHNGIDISTFRSGDHIVATADGKAVLSGYDPGLGNYLVLQHSHGFSTRYAHLQSFRVARGQRVQQGQTIGTLGNTGKSTGPHLHYEVHLGTSVIDPLRFLAIRPATVAGAPGTGTNLPSAGVPR